MGVRLGRLRVVCTVRRRLRRGRSLHDCLDHADGLRSAASRYHAVCSSCIRPLRRAGFGTQQREMDMIADNRLLSERSPRSSKYHPEWIVASVSGGANALWLTEWLAAALDLRPGMRVLDLGCGRASSAIFLRRELGGRGWGS